jgi:hypothetical protein
MAFSALKKFPKLLLLLSFLLYCPCSHSAAITSPDAPSSITTPKPCPVGCAPGVPGLHSLSTRPTSTSTYTGVYYSPEDIANLRANAEARARESPKPVYPYFEAAEPNYWEYVEHSGPWGGADIDFLNLAAFPSPTDVTNEQVVEEAPEEDKMIYYTEFKEFFSGLKGVSSEFTDPAKYKTAVKEGIPLPGLTTPSPYMTIAPKAKRELEESENINVKSMEGGQYLPEENEDKMVYYTEFKNFFSGLKGFSSEFTDPAKYKTAVKEGIPLPGLATPSPVLTMAFKKRNIIPDGTWPVCGNQAYDPRLVGP